MKGREGKGEKNSALSVNKGVEQPPSVNPELLTKFKKKRRKSYSVDEYFEQIRTGNRTVLSQVITLIESSRPEHYRIAQAIIEKCLPFRSAWPRRR